MWNTETDQLIQMTDGKCAQKHTKNNDKCIEYNWIIESDDWAKTKTFSREVFFLFVFTQSFVVLFLCSFCKCACINRRLSTESLIVWAVRGWMEWLSLTLSRNCDCGRSIAWIHCIISMTWMYNISNDSKIDWLRVQLIKVGNWLSAVKLCNHFQV